MVGLCDYNPLNIATNSRIGALNRRAVVEGLYYLYASGLQVTYCLSEMSFEVAQLRSIARRKSPAFFTQLT